MTEAARHSLEPAAVTAGPQLLSITDALSCEAVMLGRAAGGSEPQVLVWECEPCLVVPRRLAAAALFPAAARNLERRGFPVFVRETGGDAVVQGPGVVNVSITFTIPPNLPDRIGIAYRMLCAPLMSLLAEYGIETANGVVPKAMCDGVFNITASDRKLAGTAQRWRRATETGGAADFAVLGHLALSVDMDHRAAADAVNALYTDLGVASRVDGDAHVNLTELLPTDGSVIARGIVRSLAYNYLPPACLRRAAR